MKGCATPFPWELLASIPLGVRLVRPMVENNQRSEFRDLWVLLAVYVVLLSNVWFFLGLV